MLGVKHKLVAAILVLLILVLPIQVLAQDESVTEDAVRNTTVIVSLKSPKDIPYTDVLFRIKDASSNRPIASVPVKVSLMNIDNDAQVTFVEYLDEGGYFDYKLNPGPWLISVEVDNAESPETDFFGEQILSVTGEGMTSDIYLVAVGAIDGKVVDMQNNLVERADLQFICKSNIKTDYPEKTNLFGTFSKKIVPVGLCKISAASGSMAGSAEVEIRQGFEASVEIVLDQKLGNGSFGTTLLYAVIIIVIVLGIGLGVGHYILRKKKSNNSSASVTEIQNIELESSSDSVSEDNVVNVVSGPSDTLNLRAKDIINTLNEREKQVVEYLLENDNKSTQAKIRNSTGIPKTSLARIFLTLEKKKVLGIETIGKLKKITLTDWFLGKE